MSSNKPPIPTAFTIVAVLLAVALIIGAFMYGRILGAPEPEPSETPIPPLAAPSTLGGLALSDQETPEPVAGVEKEIVRATYTDGTQRVALALSRPETDLEAFLTDAGISNLQEKPDAPSAPKPEPGPSPSEGEPEPEASPSPAAPTMSPVMCGSSSDTQLPACAQISDEEARLVLALSEVEEQQLLTMLNELP